MITKFMTIVKIAATVMVCAVLITAGMAAAVYMVRTRPQPTRQEPPQLAPLVKTITVYRETHPVLISAMGVVMPAVQVTLNARVTGAVTAIHPQFHAGGIVKAGVELVAIEPDDYKLAIPVKEAQLEMARYEMMAEQGQQEVARHEWELLDMERDASTLEQELALRKPQLRQKESSVRAAEAVLELAKMDLSRTSVKAPCNALVLDTEVNVGDLATPQKILATIVGTDAYWVQTSLPTEDLSWLVFPEAGGEKGSEVNVHCLRGGIWKAQIIALLGELEPSGRMARIRVEVQDPLVRKDNKDCPPLLLGDYVRVEFIGREAKEVFSIPRDALHDGKNVWLVDESNHLQFEEVEVVWSDASISLVRGLNDGNRLVVSDLAGPVAGMNLQIHETTGSNALPLKSSSEETSENTNNE